MPSDVRHSQTHDTTVEKKTTQASSIMMDVMRLMTRTQSINTAFKSRVPTPASIVRQQQEADEEARRWNRRRSLSGAAVAVAFSALMAAACFGVVYYFVEQHDRAVTQEAGDLFRRSTERLLLGKDDPSTLAVIEQGVQELQDELQSHCYTTRLTMLVALIVILGLGTAVVGAVSISVSRKLRQLGDLSKLMEKLSTLDLSMDSEEFLRFCRGKRSNVHEIAQLQDTSDRLTKSIALFARFVPETVVQRIVLGDRRATRLYVDRRCATIMFSDIKDYTSLSEQFAHLNPRDMLFVLTRYFSIMTQIVEMYEGTVGEILGDGLLVFWNTPQNVRNHGTKACAAALAQQVALKYLNQHFASMGLPQLEIRIGLHTGQVLTGNIGSLTKMKFGCMGDPVNLASRLEGLCKVYGVGIVCSGSAHDALSPHQGFLCRRLDTVKVKGRDEPTEVYELVGRDDAAATRSSTSATAQGRQTQCMGSKRPLGYTRGDDLAPRIQDVVVEAIGGLHAMCRGVNGSSDSIWEDLSTEEDASVRVEIGSMDPVGAVTVTVEQQARVTKYEDALSSLQQGNFSVAYQLASELLEETPGDLATARLRDIANEKCTNPENLPGKFLMSASGSSVLSELIVTTMNTK
jgi:class 3 adenylate cyclase